MENVDLKNRICRAAWFAGERPHAGPAVQRINLPSYLQGQFEGIEMPRFRLIRHRDLNIA